MLTASYYVQSIMGVQCVKDRGVITELDDTVPILIKPYTNLGEARLLHGNNDNPVL